MFEDFPPKSVVVGIDGSRAAIRAALWAVDEVAGTHIPLRLRYIRQLNPAASRSETQAAMVTAEEAVYEAYNAVEAAGKPGKVEMEIVEGRTVPALIEASESTPLLCIGDIGSGQTSPAGLGSTATALVHSAHCSVAVVRADHSQEPTHDRWIVAHITGSNDDAFVLASAFEEANRRSAPLVVMTAGHSGLHEHLNDAFTCDYERRMCAILDRYVAIWQPHYPGVDVRTAVASSGFLEYLAEQANAIQLVIVGATQKDNLQQLVSPAADHALRHSDFALLVVR